MRRIGGLVVTMMVLALAIVAVPQGTLAVLGGPFPFVGGFQFFDDFASLLLERTLWIPAESSPGGSAAPNTDTFRGIVLTKTGPQAQLTMHNFGHQNAGNTGSTGSSQQRLDFTSPGDITAIIALVTVPVKPIAIGCTANTDSNTLARVQIQGRVFNSSVGAPVDQTNDVVAGIQLVQDSRLGAQIQAFVVRCLDGQCNTFESLLAGSGVFATTWALKKPLYYGIQWDQPNKKLIAAVLDQNFNNIESAEYDYGAAGISDAHAPFLDRKSLGVSNRTANCQAPAKRTEANMTVLFDDVFVNQ